MILMLDLLCLLCKDANDKISEASNESTQIQVNFAEFLKKDI